MNEIYSISIDDIDDENGESVNVIKTVAQHIFNENKKNKIPLIITGSGISSNIPGMPDIMNKICDLLNEHRKKDKFSSTLDEIQNNYEKNKESENRFLFQSTLLTYIQCAYLSEQNDYVEHNDIEPLKLIWNQFVRWLLEGDDSEKEGLLAALPTNTHKEIVEMYKSMNAVSITTNFDNLLSKAFNNKEDKFFPLLTNEDFEKYYLNIPSELSSENLQMVEIQSRGDVFWTRCSGKNSAICPSTKTRCYIPEEKVDFNEDNSIKCSICKSPTDVYFAFPGTKEKDYEMSKVFDMVWKYIALRCSTIIIVGSSMNYDPVLLNFILELAKRKEIAILYISARNTDREITNKLLYDTPKNRWWLYGKDSSEKVLARLNKTYSEFEKSADNYKKENEYNYKAYIKYASGSIGVKSVDDFVDIAKESGNTIFVDEILTNLKKYSQLGLKTFWISSDKNIVAMHNRYKHSICTMLIASAIYLAAKKSKATNNELHFLQVAALLHDVGHLPFSHLIEEIFTEFGWIPYGERKPFNHEYNTKNKIKDYFDSKKYSSEEEKPEIVKFFESTGYTTEDLLRLIDGEFGVGYLDAIINSPIDADKIEYLFTDGECIGRNNLIPFDTFLKDFCQNISCNENKFLVLSDTSTARMLDLIKIRADMYDKIYLRSGLRYLESCCKLIIRTYIAHLFGKEEYYKWSKEKIEGNRLENRYQNLSSIKIEYVIKCIEDIINKTGSAYKDNICELDLIDEMQKDLKNNLFLSAEIKKSLEFCCKKIKEIKSEEAINKIETNFITSIEVTNSKINIQKLNNLIKTVNLRFPGILLLDYVESKAAFSFSNSYIPKKRSDGTRQRCENIIVKDLVKNYNLSNKDSAKCLGDSSDYIINKYKITQNSIINIYRICDESYNFSLAKDFVISELRELGIEI